MYDYKFYHRANSRLSPRPIARFAKELQRFVCDRATLPIIESVWRFRILQAYWKSIKWTWVEPFEMNAKIERVSNFALYIESHRFFDA